MQPHQLAVLTRAQAAAQATTDNALPQSTKEVEQTSVAEPITLSDQPQTPQPSQPLANLNAPTLPVDNDDDDDDDEEEPLLAEAIDQAYANDEFAQEVFEALRNGVRFSKKITLSLCQERNGKLYY